MADFVANFSENNPENNANFNLNSTDASVNFSLEETDINANFVLDNEELNADFEADEGEVFNAILQLDVIGAKWGGITGNIQAQTDLINLLNDKVNSVEETLNTEINKKVETINGSALIDVDRTVNTVTITSKTFEFEQGIASATWVIQHNLNKKPSGVFVDSNGSVQLPNEIIYNNSNKITVSFLAAFAGKAFLN